MFGFLYTLFMGGACAIKGIRDSIENEEYKQKYYDDETGIYYDRDMRKHDKATGKIVTYERNTKTGDMWVVDAENCRPLRNITMNKAEIHYQEEREKFLAGKTNKTYVRYGEDEHRHDKCEGVRFKDLATGKLYVMREIVELDRWTHTYLGKIEYKTVCNCLMDIDTGRYIRPSDSDIFYQIYYGKITEELYKKIEDANKEKKELLKYDKERCVLQSEYDNHFYSNYCRVNTSYELNEEQSTYPLKEKEMQIKRELGLM